MYPVRGRWGGLLGVQCAAGLAYKRTSSLITSSHSHCHSQVMMFNLKLLFLFAAATAIALACNDGALQFVQRSELYTAARGLMYKGTIKTCINKQWSYISSSQWDHTDARIACTELGLSEYGALARTYPVQSLQHKLPIVLTNVSCRGDELSISECTSRFLVGTGAGQTDTEGDTEISGSGSGGGHMNRTVERVAGVICQESHNRQLCTTGEVRLNGGQIVEEGQVEMCINARWGPICDSDWTLKEEGTVACRQYLKKQNARAISVYSLPKASSKPIVFNRTDCSGHENMLLECSNQIPDETDWCGSTGTVGLKCTAAAVCSEGDIRLDPQTSTSTEDKQSGIIQLCYGNQWIAICSDGHWTEMEAGVSCHQLGHLSEGAVALNKTLAGSPVDAIKQPIHCNGSESRLTQCIGNITGISKCQSNQYATVKCRERCREGDVTVKNTTIASGVVVFVSVCLNGIWRSTCDSNWTYAEASVTCKTAGFSPYGARPILTSQGSKYHTGIDSALLTDVQCSGQEPNISKCNLTSSPSDRCSHQLAGAMCTVQDVTNDNCSHGDVRLTYMSKRKLSGVFEICINGLWKQLCHKRENTDINKERKIGRVMCGQLGYGKEEHFPLTSRSVANQTALSLKIDCHGNESKLTDCLKKMTVQELSESYASCSYYVTYLDCKAIRPHITSLTQSKKTVLYREDDDSNTVTFTCIATGTPPLSVKWTFVSVGSSSVPVELSSSNASVVKPGEVVSILNISQVTAASNGQYICGVTNIEDKLVTRSAFLTVKVAPRVQLEVNSAKEVLVEGSKAVVSCTGWGYPRPRLSLLKDHHPVLSPDSMNCTRNSSSQGGEEGGVYVCQLVLDVLNVVQDDGGMYTCRAAEQDDLPATHQSAHLAVWGYPRVLRRPQNMTVHLNHTTETSVNVTITCILSGTPLPTVVWHSKLEGEPQQLMKNKTDHSIFTERVSSPVGGSSHSGDVITSSLHIFNVTVFDSGDYWCEGLNNVGVVYSKANLLVYKIPSLNIQVHPSAPILESSNVTIDCIAKDARSLLIDLKWIIYNRTMETQPTPLAIGDTNDVKSTLNFPSINLYDSGMYKCVLTTKLGTNFTAVTIVKVLPRLKIQFTDGPYVDGHSVWARIESKPSTSMMCSVGKLKEDCSSGIVRFNDVSSEQDDDTHSVTLTVTALSLAGERMVIERKFYTWSPNLCSVHLINNGITVNGSNATVEFTGVGHISFYTCRIDAAKYQPCTSPFVVTKLTPGAHALNIKPRGCGHRIVKKLTQNFTIH